MLAFLLINYYFQLVNAFNYILFSNPYMKRRKGNKEVPSFIDMEADEESSLDNLSVEEESEDIDGVSSTQIEPRPRDWQKFTEDLAKKYGEGEEEEEDESSEKSDIVDEVKRTPQYLLLPNSRSPRLWIIRVIRGKEKEICLRIFNHLTEGNGIISIISKPDLLGYIYIESFTKQAVIDALQSVRFVNRTRISAVPLNEMIDVLTIKCVEDVKIGAFVRVKKGKYKNDVAQVISIVNNEMIRIRIVPRIDVVQKKFDENGFDEKLVQTKIINKRKVYIYKKEMYVDGFLEKDVMKTSLYFDTDVSFEEARVFEKKRKFSINEKVRVRRGDLINMVGLIKNIERNEIEMEVSGEIFRMDVDAVEKSYSEGDEISFNGRNAVILNNDKGHIGFIYTDTFGEAGSADIDEIEPPITQRKFEVVKNVNMRKTKRDPYLNQSVQIQNGPYKGYFGVVKDVFKDSCRVLMDSNLKYVNVDRIDCDLRESYSIGDVPNEESQYNEDGFSGYGPDKTPNYKQDYGRTPSYRKDFGKTPSYRKDFGKTPNYRNEFGKTPAYQNEMGRTPGYQNEMGRTPGYQNEMGRTPGYQNESSRTPGHPNDGGRTPGYRSGNERTPGYKSGDERTPGYQNESSKTPGYRNESSRTPGYRKDNERTSGYQNESRWNVGSKNEYNNRSINNERSTNRQEYRNNRTSNYSTNNEKNVMQNPGTATDWVRGDDTINVMVKIDGKERILKEIRNSKYILDDNDEYGIVNWVFPEKYDKVRVMEGKEEGYMGILIGIEENIGIVRDDNGDVKNIKVDYLTKRN